MSCRSSAFLVLTALAVAVGGAPALHADSRGETQLDELISSNGAFRSSEPHVATDGATVHAVWSERESAGSTSEDVYYARSTDGGKTWSDPTRLDADDLADDVNPYVAADADVVVVGWLSGDPQDVWAAVSSDGGATFGAGQAIASGLIGDTGDADHLRLVVREGYVYVVFEDDAANPGEEEDVYAVSSTDSGATFGAATLINDGGAGLFDTDDPEIATTGLAAYIVWIDARSGGDQVYLSHTLDGGATWSANQRIDSTPDGADVGSPKIAVKGDKVYVVWLDDRNPITGDQVYYTRSLDAAATFETDVPLGAVPPGTDMDDPDLALGGPRLVYVSWCDDRNGPERDVYVTASSNAGDTFGFEVMVNTDAGLVDSFDPRLAAHGDQVYVAYQQDRDVDGNHDVWLAFSPDTAQTGTWHNRLMSTGLADGSDCDGQQIAVTDFRDATVVWVDNRAGDGNAFNDVYTNGIRLPELTMVLDDAKTYFILDHASPSDEGMFFLALFSTTGTDWTALPDPSGIHMCLTVDATTFALIQPPLLAIFGATIVGGTAQTIPIKLPFNGHCTGVVIDLLVDPVEFPAATDPVDF